MQTVFHRVEKKYLLYKEQYEILKKEIKQYMVPDQHGTSSICNLYFDTEQFDLIKRSIEKPIYKEKIRIRSYGIPNIDSMVFLEIKKKYKKIVNKRRIRLPLYEAYQYINHQENSSQIEKEISYAFHLYHLKPVVFISYDRSSFFHKDDSNFRITFDQNIRYRTEDLKLEFGHMGKTILPNNTYLMEVKTNFSYPLWFTDLLSKLKIYPISFSKYGTVYQILKEEHYV